MMDDIEIAELFIGRNANADSMPEPVMLFAADDAFGLALRFLQIDPKVRLLSPDSGSRLDWSSLVHRGEEQWPIAFLMPSGAYVK
jgi:hypothetical protein